MLSLIDLCRVKVSLFAALSAAAGFVLVAPQLRSQVVIVFAGVFLLACGASGLNQYQERATDALMTRTKNRPMPSGRINPINALLFSLAVALSGLAILFSGFNSMTAVLGLFAALWYNGIYTSLKKKSAFAAIPGALTGALPPAIGWTAAGGHLSDPRLLALSLFFAIWQVPHFWLFLLNHGNEYEEAGLPSLTLILSRAQIKRIIFQWIAATAACGPALCLFGFARSPLTQYSLAAASVWLIFQGIGFARDRGGANCSAFGRINVYVIAVMSLLVFDSLYLSVA